VLLLLLLLLLPRLGLLRLGPLLLKPPLLLMPLLWPSLLGPLLKPLLLGPVEALLRLLLPLLWPLLWPVLLGQVSLHELGARGGSGQLQHSGLQELDHVFRGTACLASQRLQRPRSGLQELSPRPLQAMLRPCPSLRRASPRVFGEVALPL
jgi:hypothetical protein